MDSVIYSVSPLRAFTGGFVVIAFMLGLGVIGALWAAFNRRERALGRIVTGCASIILLLAGIGVVITLVRTVQSGDKTVVVLVNERKEVVSNCGNSNGTCTSYLLETNAGQKFYDFTVAKVAWEKAEVGACYEFTYYPGQSLFGQYLQEQDYSDSYEAASTITRIEKVSCP